MEQAAKANEAKKGVSEEENTKKLERLKEEKRKAQEENKIKE